MINKTLTNPTDEDLNKAFAEEVCGWKWTRIFKAIRAPGGGFLDPARWAWCDKDNKFVSQGYDVRFAQSADDVLPWLNREPWGASTVGLPENVFAVTVYGAIVDMGSMNITPTKAYAESSTFSRAAVIALLRSNGVQVEFTQTPQ